MLSLSALYVQYNVTFPDAAEAALAFSHLSILGSGSTRNNLDKLTSNDSLSRSVEENLELVNHVASVLGCIVHGVATSGDFASVAFCECPVKGVGEGVFAEVAED